MNRVAAARELAVKILLEHQSSVTLKDLRSYKKSCFITHWEIQHQRHSHLPTNIVTKFAEDNVAAIAREAEFYERLLPCNLSKLSPRYFGHSSSMSGAALALEDVSTTRTPAASKPSTAPNLEINKAVFNALATVHTAFWNHAELKALGCRGNIVAKQPGEVANNLNTLLHSFAGSSGQDSTVRILLEDVTEKYARIAIRQVGQTLIHGDAHPGNFLISRTKMDALIIDWAAWKVGCPTDDLAYYLTLCFPPGDRREQEQTLLEHYYYQLPIPIRNIYGWERFILDYRVSIIGSATIALTWVAKSQDPWAMDSMEFIMEACRDWECCDLT